MRSHYFIPTLALLTLILGFDIVYSNSRTKSSKKSPSSPGFNNSNLFNQFMSFAHKHNRQYLNNSSELLHRFKIFKESLLRANSMNSDYGEEHPVYGINKFADFSESEFRGAYLSDLRPSKNVLKFKGSSYFQKSHSSVNFTALPKMVDWRRKLVVNQIRDQKSCGACWAFSVTGVMESMSSIQYKIPVPSLSVQQFIDCDTGNKGCEGGDICEAAIWAENNGIVSDSEYPLTDHTDTCKSVSTAVKRVMVTNHSCANMKGAELNLLQTVAYHGPVAVAVDATTWHNYVGGIIKYHCSDHINHAVQIVGYNLLGNVPYYIIRNSWGEDFGDSGYLYLKYGDNLCGVAQEVVLLNVGPQR